MRLLNVKTVCFIVGVARSTIYRWIEDGTFPQPLKLSEYRTGPIRWREEEINRWLESRSHRALP